QISTFDPLTVTDVSEHHVVVAEVRCTVHAQQKRVQRGLVAVEHHQLARAEGGDLAAQLGADGSSGPGDQHDPAGQHLGDLAQVGDHRAAAQEILGPDLAQVGVADPVDHL